MQPRVSVPQFSNTLGGQNARICCPIETPILASSLESATNADSANKG